MQKRIVRSIVPIAVSVVSILMFLTLLRATVTYATAVVVSKDGKGEYSPAVIAGNPSNGKLYYGRYRSSCCGEWPEGEIEIIDERSGVVISTLFTPLGPAAMDVNPVTNQVYVVPWLPSEEVYILDGTTDTMVSARAGIYSYHTDVAVNSVTNKIYLAGYQCCYDNNLSIFNADTSSTKLIALGGHGSYVPPKIVVITNTNKVYVTTYGGVLVIDGVTDAIVSLIPVGTNPANILANKATNRLYVANRVSNTVSIIDGSTDSVVATVAVGAAPETMTLDPSTNGIYIANSGDGSVSVIDGLTDALRTTIDVGGTPSALDVDAALSRLYVSTGNHIKAVNTTTNVVLEPALLHLDSDSEFNFRNIKVMPSHKVYVASWQGWRYTLADIDLDSSRIDVSPDTVPAGGRFTSRIHVKLMDFLANPVSGIDVYLNASGEHNGIGGSGTSTNSAGQMYGQIVSAASEQKVITATFLGGNALSQNALVTFTEAPTLSSGWHLLSLPLTPSEPAPSQVFGSIAGNYSVVLSFEGQAQTFDPALPGFSTLTQVDHAHGFWLRMERADSLNVTGIPAAPHTPIELEEGWNLVSYLLSTPLPVSQALASIAGAYGSVLGYDEGALSYYLEFRDVGTGAGKPNLT